MSEKMKVAIRLRPLSEKEKAENLVLHWKTEGNSIFQVDPVAGRPKSDALTFDYVFGEDESNAEIFDKVIKPIVDASMQGFNGTVFAYGQTSSGKTFTMSGNARVLGIIPLAINYMFFSIENTPGREFLLRVSYMEIYNEKVNDLLEIKNKNLKLHEDSNGQVIVDVEERVCKTSQEVMEQKYKGDKNRRIGETNMNERSSRSHTIFRIILESRTTDDEDGVVKVSHINLVDLAGSERAGQSGATGDRFKEGCHINSSLTTLGLVINQLSEGQEGQFVNFRDSKLTRLLQSSLGGNAMTVIICAVTPAAEDQTQNTLNFALRAKKVKITPILNEVLSDAALIKRYRRQIAKLSQELQDMKNKNTTLDVQEMESKLKEKEELNERLTVRINRLKEALIVSSSSPMKLNKSKSRSRRRMTWGGQCDRRSLFPNTGSALDTISEDTLVPMTPQANSTRLDEIVCPFEKFELELMKTKDSFWSPEGEEMYEDARENIASSNSIKLSETTMYSINEQPDVTLTLVNPSIKRLLQDPETPPGVLRERISLMSNTLNSVVKDYDELREYTTLEKQIAGVNDPSVSESQIIDLKNQNSYLIQQNRSLQADLNKKNIAYECLQNQYCELNVAFQESIGNNKINNEVNIIEKELVEFKEQNEFLKTELKLKSESYDDLHKRYDDINAMIVSLRQDNSEIQEKCEKLQKKLQSMEKKNLDLEVTLDLKKKMSVERESELERALQNAWEALEKRGQLVTRTVDESKLCPQERSELIENEQDKTVNTLDGTLTNNYSEIDYLSVGRDSVPDSDIKFVSCNTSLIIDQSVTCTLPVDPLQSFCLNESMRPVNVSDTPRKASRFVECLRLGNGGGTNDDHLPNNENTNYDPLLESYKEKYEKLCKESEKQIKDLNSQILEYNQLVTQLCNTVDCSKDNDISYQDSTDQILKLKYITEKIEMLQAEKENLNVKLEEYKNYDIILNKMKMLFVEERIETNDIPDFVLSLKNKLISTDQQLKELEKQNTVMLDYHNEEISKLKEVDVIKDSYEKLFHEVCILLSDYLLINVNESELINSDNNHLKEQLNSVKTKLQNETNHISMITEMQSKLDESSQQRVLLNGISELLNQELKDGISDSEIIPVLQSVISCKKKYEMDIDKFNSEILTLKSSELLLNEICSLLRDSVADSESLTVKKIVLSLIESKAELDDLNARMPLYQENEVIVNNVASLLTNNRNTKINNHELLDAISVLISDNTNLKEQLINEQEGHHKTKKEFLQKFEEMKIELENTDNVLQKMCSALRENLEADISKSNVIDTVLSLIQYKEKCNIMSSSIEQQKDLSETITNLQHILGDDLNDKDGNKIEEIVASLKKTNIELKKQLQDGNDATIMESELKTEISTIKAELEANKLYETIVNDVCSILNEEESDSESVTLDRVKNSVTSLKESNADLKKRLDNLQNANTQSESQYKSEIDMLKSELQTGKVYESVMNELLDVLQDVHEMENESAQIDVKSAVLTLKERNAELKKVVEELKNEISLKESQHLLEVGKLDSELTQYKNSDSIIIEICTILQEDSKVIQKNELINLIKKLKSINKELKESLDDVRNSYANNEMMLTEIELLKNEVESNRECKEIIEDICYTLQSHSEGPISMNNVREVVMKVSEVAKTLQNQIKESQDSHNKRVSEYITEIQELKTECDKIKPFELVIQDVCCIVQEGNTDFSQLKNNIISLKEENDKMKCSLETVNEAKTETEIQYRHEIDFLKSELEAGKVFETVMDDLLTVLQEGNEYSVARDNVKTAVVNLKESNLELKRLLEQVEGMNNEKQSSLLKEIEQLQFDLNATKRFEVIVNNLLFLLKKETGDITCDELEEAVQSLKKVNEESIEQLENIRKDKELLISENKILKDENEKYKIYERTVVQLCDLLELTSDCVKENKEVVTTVTELKNSVNVLTDKLNVLEIQFKEKENILLKDISSLQDEIQNKIELESIVNNLCSKMVTGTGECLMKNDLENFVMSMMENSSELKTKLEEVTVVKNSEIDVLKTKITEQEFLFQNKITKLVEDFNLKETNLQSLCDSLENQLAKQKLIMQNFISELSLLQDELDCEVDIQVDNLRNVVIKMKEENLELKERVADLESLNNDLRMQHKSEINTASEEVENFKQYKEFVNLLCRDFEIESSENEISLLKVKLDDLVNESSNYKKEMECLRIQLTESTEEFKSNLSSLESELVVLRDYETIVNEIRTIVYENAEECPSIKSFISSLKEENCLLKNMLDEINIEKKSEIDNLKEKLESYTECVDICFNLCLLLNDGCNKGISKQDIRDVVIRLLKENADLNQQLSVIKSSVMDENSYSKCEIERLEKKLEEATEFETIVDNICGVLSKIDNTCNVAKENIVGCINQLQQENKRLEKELENERAEKLENSIKFQAEISGLENTCARLVRCQEIVTYICKSFGINEKMDTDEINKFINEFRNRTVSFENDLTVLKQEYNEFTCCCKGELEKLNTLLESHKHCAEIVTDIIKLNISESADIHTLVDSIKSLKSAFNELKQESEEMKLLKDRLTSEKERYDLMFEDIKALLGLQSNYNESDISSVIQSLKKCETEYQNTLLLETGMKTEIGKLQSDLEDYNDFFNSLQTIVSYDNERSFSKSGVITAVASLKESKNLLNERLTDLESANEGIIAKLNVANEDLKSKLQTCNENENILCDLIKFCSENVRNITSKYEVLDALNDMNDKLLILKSENDNLRELESENAIIKTEIELYKSNENAFKELLKSIPINHDSIPGNLTTTVIDDVRNYIINLQKKVNECDLKIITSIKTEINNIKEQIMMIFDCVENKSLRIVDSGSDMNELKTILTEVKVINECMKTQKLHNSGIKKKLINEIKNLKPSFDVESYNESSVKLLEQFFSLIMEKETEIYKQMRNNFENDCKKMQDNIKQLKEERDKLKSWSQHLENDVITNLNEEINIKSEKLETFYSQENMLEKNIKDKSDEISDLKKKLCEAETVISTLNIEISEIKLTPKNDDEINLLKSHCEKLKKEIVNKDNQIDNMLQCGNEKQSEISDLQKLIDHKDSLYTKLSKEFKEMESQVFKIKELEKCKEILEDSVSELKVKLDEKSSECCGLKVSLNKIEKEYGSALQSLETNSKGSSLLRSQLDEVTLDLETTKRTLHNLMESVKVDQLNNEKEICSYKVLLEEKNKVCQKLELELSFITKKCKVAETNTRTTEHLENKIAELINDLDKERVAKDRVIQELAMNEEKLKEKENFGKEIETNLATMAQEISLHRDIITKLKIEIKSKDEECSELEKINREKLKLIDNMESELRLERQNSKKLRMKNESLMRKLETSEQKENFPSGKAFSPNSNVQLNNENSVYADKLRKIEKELFSLFETTPKSLECALLLIKDSFEKAKTLESQLAEVELEKSDLDQECETMNEHIKQLNIEINKQYVKEESLLKRISELEAELKTKTDAKRSLENVDLLRVDNGRVKQLSRDSKVDKKLFSTSEKNLDVSGKDIDTPLEFQTLKHKWEQISKATPNKEYTFDEILNTVRELKQNLADKDSKIAMLEIQIQGENFPYKKKAMQLEEALNESKTKIMALKQEVRRLQSCLHEVTVFRECETGSSRNMPMKIDVAVQTLSDDLASEQGEPSYMGASQKQHVKLLQEKLNKVERHCVLLKRLCRDRNTRIESLEQKLKMHGLTG